jgi:hypothetical protein
MVAEPSSRRGGLVLAVSLNRYETHIRSGVEPWSSF